MGLNQKANKIIYEDFRDWVNNESTSSLNMDSNSSVIDYISYLFKKGTLNARNLRSINKSKFKLFIEEIKFLKIGDVYRDTIDKSLDNSLGDIPNRKILRHQFKKTLFSHAVEDNILSEHYDRYFMQYKYNRHLENRSDVLPKDRVVGWYVCEYLYKRSQEGKSNLAPEFTSFKQLLKSYWYILPQELNIKLIDITINRNKLNLRTFLVYMNVQGFKFDIQSLSNVKSDVINFESDVWNVIDKKERVTINFERFSSEGKMKDYLKSWMKDRIQTKKIGHKKYLRLVELYFIEYLKENNIKLLNFSSNQKRMWLAWLREGIASGEFKNGTIRNAVGAVKQFVNFLRDNKKVKFRYSFAWIEGKDSIPDRSKKRKAYEQWELGRIVNALKYDNDKVLVNIEKLILLTGRRLGEVLSLRHDCLVDIASVKCIKYINSKSSKEAVFPLPTKKSEDDDGLFLMNPKEVIVEAINELLEERQKGLQYCSKEDKDFLIIENFKNFNTHGYLSGRMTTSNFYNRLYSFKIRNRINFELESHRFRNTIATRIIRDTGDINAASKVLGNTPATVARHYESELSKNEIVEKGDLFIIDAEDNAKKILEMNNVPEVCGSDYSCEAAVPGGFCKEGLEAMLNCKFYNRLFGKGGCLGCSQLAVTEENKRYYEDLKENVVVELERNTGTPSAKASMAKFRLVKTTLKNIENAKDSQWN